MVEGGEGGVEGGEGEVERTAIYLSSAFALGTYSHIYPDHVLAEMCGVCVEKRYGERRN